MKQESKGEAIRYWEKRRIVWNVLLVPPALLGYVLPAGIAAGIGDRAMLGWPEVLAMFCFAAVGANICYSFAYVVEFWIQGSGVEKEYRKYGRTLLFVLGSLLGIGLALMGGASIAQMRYPM